ncbi:MAG: flagellar biosynthesis anti-sigma factor FlgM [Bdellovibrionales bacterium]
MKISNGKPSGTNHVQSDPLRSTKTDAAQTKANDKAGAKNAKDLSGSTNLNLSERAQMMQKAKDIATAPSNNDARVAELQKMIDEGRYQVDAKSVADRLVDDHLAIPD